MNKTIIGLLSDLKTNNSTTTYEEGYYELLDMLRVIDTHIRSTDDPIPFIVDTLKQTLPEYKE